MKAVVAAGHKLVCQAAFTILNQGGNAYDAAAAAGFMSAIAEPALSSLGGGGFLLAHSAAGEEILFDFFSDTPGLGLKKTQLNPHFYPVTVGFSGSTQDFHVGMGSVAVPGCLAGYLHVHERLGRLPLANIVAPAIEAARHGVQITSQQAHFFELLQPILTMHEAGRRIYAPHGTMLTTDELLINTDYANFLTKLSKEPNATLYQGELATIIARDMATGKGLLSKKDLHKYTVIERQPLRGKYRGLELLTNPAPSFGGSLLCQALNRLEKYALHTFDFGSPPHLMAHAQVMIDVEDKRRQPQCSRGTTHISISDSDGNLAAMTTSNGEGSGYIVPGTGIMLNNMMGEDDLHPEGFHSSPPGIRVASMMCPTILLQDDQPALVIGSGGSKRIRTAIAQVISHVIDFKMDIQQAVELPRLHWDGKILQLEPGFTEKTVAQITEKWPSNVWISKGVYFGGVHGVLPGISGGGDPRRGGTTMMDED